MSERVVFLLSGPAHLPYLLCSLRTLRNHWAGDVHVYAWPESFRYMDMIAQDKRLFVDGLHLREPVQRGRNSQFLDKIRLVQGLASEADKVIYLDADTTIHGSLQPLLMHLERYSFVATQFCDWTTLGTTVRNRLDRLREIPEIDCRAIDLLATTPFPSVNGGVWAARPESPVLQRWEEWTAAAKERVFIADEAVLHLLQVLERGMWVVTEHGRFNTSPKYQSDKLNAEQVVVMHYHGDSNVRPNKSLRGYEMWMPLWQEAWEDNLGGCRDWWPAVQADRATRNKWMHALETQDG